jgi:preflagellin peptidase FlaK
MQIILDATRAALSLIFLLYASWSDYKTREVSNKVWAIFAPCALALSLLGLVLYEPSQLLVYGMCFGLTAAFAIILFYSGGFGGADSKALMCLALALPFYPERLFTPILGEVSAISRSFFPITIFSNSVLFAALTAVAMLLYNMLQRLKTGKELFEGEQRKESIGKKILVLITGYKVSVDMLNEKWHIYPLEDIEEDTEQKLKRKLIILPKDEGRNDIVARLNRGVKSGKIQDKVWATPGLPMLIFVTAGLVVALFFGDIVWTCVRLILR